MNPLEMTTTMKKITTNFLRTAGLSLAAATVTLCGMTACTSDDNITADEPAIEQPAEAPTFTVCIPATIGSDATTRAVEFDGNGTDITTFFQTTDKIYVYNEKARQAEEFNRQHRNWMITQAKTFFRNVRYLPAAIMNRHYDLIDKLLQWMLMPRMMMMALITIMCIVIPFIYMTAALKWWALFAIVVFIFALATPNYLVDEKWDSTFFKLPFVLFSSVLEKFKLGRMLKDKVNLKQ